MSYCLDRLGFLLFLCFAAPVAFGQSYTSILVFGDSLSDTGNVAHLTQSQFGVRIPAPLSGYTDGRFTDGTDTVPAATLYSGVWIEQLAATFPAKPAVTDSLDGGTNYAYGFAFTGTGTSPLDLTTGVTVQVDNVGQQVTDYLSAHPAVPADTLVVIWGGANDVINATAAADITTAVTGELTAIQRLVTAGATDVLVVNLPPLGAIPRFNTTANSAAVTAGAQAFNSGLAAGLAALPGANSGKTLNLKPLDVFTLFNSVIASPSANGLINVTDKSQADLTVNPDRYFFWDDLHPTTTVHHLIALAAAALVAPPAPSPSFSVALSPTSVTVKAGLPATSTVTVTPANGFSGTVTLACGSLPSRAACDFSPSTLTFTSASSAAQSRTLSIATNGSPSSAFLLVPLTGLGALFALRRRRLNPGLMLIIFTLSTGGLVGLSGCGASSSNTPNGTYTIPVTATPSTGSPTTIHVTLIVQ